MQVAICTDIHGNRHAFEAVIAAAEEAGAEELWCLGDLVGYGAEPDACVALADAHCTICLAGNHDLAVVERALARRLLPRRGARRALDAGGDLRRRRASSCSRSSRQGERPRATGSSTPPRATRSGSTCCPA